MSKFTKLELAALHSIFAETPKSKRIATPLTSGRYKLQELLTALEYDCDQLVRIMRAKMESKSRVLRRTCVAPEDASSWLKALPVNVCHRLGYDTAAAVQALAGDGVPMVEIRRIASAVEVRMGVGC